MAEKKAVVGKKSDKNEKNIDKASQKGTNKSNNIVTFDVRREKWKACATDAVGKVNFIGFFDTEEEAKNAKA